MLRFAVCQYYGSTLNVQIKSSCPIVNNVLTTKQHSRICIFIAYPYIYLLCGKYDLGKFKYFPFSFTHSTIAAMPRHAAHRNGVIYKYHLVQCMCVCVQRIYWKADRTIYRCEPWRLHATRAIARARTGRSDSKDVFLYMLRVRTSSGCIKTDTRKL